MALLSLGGHADDAGRLPGAGHPAPPEDHASGPVRVLAAQLAVKLAVAAIRWSLRPRRGQARVRRGRCPGSSAGSSSPALLAAAALMAIGLFVAAVAPNARAARGDRGDPVLPADVLRRAVAARSPRMPAVLQHISHATPLGAAVPGAAERDAGAVADRLQLLTLAAYAVAFGLAAARFFRWE